MLIIGCLNYFACLNKCAANLLAELALTMFCSTFLADNFNQFSSPKIPAVVTIILALKVNTFLVTMSSYWAKRRRILKGVERDRQEIAAANDALLAGILDFDQVNPPVNEHQHAMATTSQGQTVTPEEHEVTVDEVFDPCEMFSSSTEDSEEEEVCLRTQLAGWAIDHRIPHVALGKLLTILSKDHPTLPRHPRTLLKTVTCLKTTELSGGVYNHSGIESGIVSQMLGSPELQKLTSVSMQVNVDGLPLFKSSNSQFWPVLGLIEQFVGSVQQNKLPFVVGIYYGKKKPTSLHFLNPFVEEAQRLESEGVLFEGRRLPFKISTFICDAPARALIRNVKGHSGYYGCDKCVQKGIHYENRMTFPQTDASLRLDNAVHDELSDDSHQCGETPLALLSVGLVTQFPLDYMHLVCLGVTRKLLHLWLKGRRLTRFSPSMIKELSRVLLTFTRHVPCEFNRKQRSMEDVERWKATEFRQFLLYTGPVSLKGIVPTQVYNNFMLLSVGITILLNVSLCAELADYAHGILVLFVDHCSKLYGKQHVTYNMHGLVHLSQDAKMYGVLDNISCFPFENFLGCLKKMLRKPTQPLEQVVRRLSERSQHRTKSISKTKSLREHNHGPLLSVLSVKTQYEEFYFQDFVVKLSEGDNCVLLENKDIVVIQNIVIDEMDNTFVIYKRFRSMVDFFTYPVESSKLGIFHLSALSDTLRFTPTANVQKKYFLLPCPDGKAGFPLIHS